MRAAALVLLVTCSCASFGTSDASPPSADADADAGADGSSSSSSGSTSSGNVPPTPTPPPSGCSSFHETFEAWAPSPGGWAVVQNAGTNVATSSAWQGHALLAHFNVLAAGTTNGMASHSFTQTLASCPLVIDLDVRARATTDAGRWLLLIVQGKAGSKVTIEHGGSFWYLHAGNTQTQIAFPTYNAMGHVHLTIQDSGAHAVVTYTYNGQSYPIDDLGTVIGSGADVQLGAQLQGATTGANEAEFDDLDVSW